MAISFALRICQCLRRIESALETTKDQDPVIVTFSIRDQERSRGGEVASSDSSTMRFKIATHGKAA
jgi:hypothetical protein